MSNFRVFCFFVLSSLFFASCAFGDGDNYDYRATSALSKKTKENRGIRTYSDIEKLKEQRANTASSRISRGKDRYYTSDNLDRSSVASISRDGLVKRISSSADTGSDKGNWPVIVVEQNDTLGQVSRDFKVSINDIKTVNNIPRDSNNIFIGQRLVIPTGSRRDRYVIRERDIREPSSNLYQQHKKPDKEALRQYGESLSQRGSLFNSKVPKNKLPSSQVRNDVLASKIESYDYKPRKEIRYAKKPDNYGQEIDIKPIVEKISIFENNQRQNYSSKIVKITSLPPCSSSDGRCSVYKVQEGDSLSEIADKFNTNSSALMELNLIKDVNKIRLGQQLIIPNEVSKDLLSSSEDYRKGSLSPTSSIRRNFVRSNGFSDNNHDIAVPYKRPVTLDFAKSSSSRKLAANGYGLSPSSLKYNYYDVHHGTFSSDDGIVDRSVLSKPRLTSISAKSMPILKSLSATTAKSNHYANSPTNISFASTSSTKRLLKLPLKRPRLVSHEGTSSGGKLARGAAELKKNFSWPIQQGSILSEFNMPYKGKTNDGLKIKASPGTPIFATLEGEVFYIGDDIPDLGNMIIIKHGDELVSIYGFTENILVKPGDRVKLGQQISQLASNRNDNVDYLHFEIRKNAKPVDPMKLLIAPE